MIKLIEIIFKSTMAIQEKRPKSSVDYLQMESVLKYYFHAEVGIILNLFLNFEQKCASCFYEIILRKSVFSLTSKKKTT